MQLHVSLELSYAAAEALSWPLAVNRHVILWSLPSAGLVSAQAQKGKQMCHSASDPMQAAPCSMGYATQHCQGYAALAGDFASRSLFLIPACCSSQAIEAQQLEDQGVH